jgi:DNA-binding NarL/FixJ family response regulator
MTSTPRETRSELFGRESELRQIETFLNHATAGTAALVLEGEPGIGKTSLWLRAVSAAKERGWIILSCRSVEAEARLSFAALGDLIGAVEDAVLEELPAPQRRGLEVALLRAEPEGPPPDRRAVGAAILGIVGSLSATIPLLLALDDVQWVDPPTSHALEFALRRLTDEQVGILLSSRTLQEGGPPLALTRALPEERVRMLQVGPLSSARLDQLVRSRLGTVLPPPALRRLEEVSGGNPFFALEIARAEIRGEPRPTGQSLPIPRSLREDVVRHRMASVPTPTRGLLLAASAVSHPTTALLGAYAGHPDIGADVTRAVEAGILERAGEQIAFAHPLFRAAVYADAGREERHRLHRRLAELVDQPEERARHLALGADEPDAAVATKLEAAAERANARGAPDAGAELYELSLRLTPSGLPTETARRTVGAAACLQASGDLDRAAAHLERLVSDPPEGSDRAGALIRFARLIAFAGDLPRSAELLETALREEGLSAGTRSEIHAELALLRFELGSGREIGEHARLAARRASGAGTGGPEESALGVARTKALMLASSGDLSRALDALDRVLAQAEELPPFDLGRTLLLLGSLRRRTKQKRSAREALEAARDVFDGIGAAAWVERSDAELARIGGRRPLSGLTESERRVAGLVAAGRTNREVADTLYTSVRTVEGHLSHIYSKLGVRSRTELALFFEESDDSPHS